MKIFLDTNIYKFSAVKHHVFVPRTTRVNWGGEDFDATWHQQVTKNAVLGIRSETQRKDAIYLPLLAKAGILGHVKFVDSPEVSMELAGLPKVASAIGRFFGCPVEHVRLPVESPRVWLGGRRTADEWTDDFLSSIDHPRFLELCRVTGAFQGQNKPLNRNQARDALHIWTAEESGADLFLTMDYKLARMVQNDPKKRVKLKIASPSDALRDLLFSLGFFKSIAFIAKSFWFAKRHVGFEDGDGWR